jgi:transcriptional regulator with XRE-family HTH domain
MIAPQIVDEVRRLLAEGRLSQRQIARATGVSRGTVGAIASGRRPDYHNLRPALDEDLLQPTGPPQRCPGCGGMVYLPCRLCRVRRLKAETSQRPFPPQPPRTEEPLALNLKEEHRLRYEEVRARRMSLTANPA